MVPSGVKSTEFPRGWDRKRLRRLAAGGAGTVLAHYPPPKGFTLRPQQDTPPVCLSSPAFLGEGPLISHNWSPLWPLSTALELGLKRLCTPLGDGAGGEELTGTEVRSGVYGGYVCESPGCLPNSEPECACVCAQVWKGGDTGCLSV